MGSSRDDTAGVSPRPPRRSRRPAARAGPGRARRALAPTAPRRPLDPEVRRRGRVAGDASATRPTRSSRAAPRKRGEKPRLLGASPPSLLGPPAARASASGQPLRRACLSSCARPARCPIPCRQRDDLAVAGGRETGAGARPWATPELAQLLASIRACGRPAALERPMTRRRTAVPVLQKELATELRGRLRVASPVPVSRATSGIRWGYDAHRARRDQVAMLVELGAETGAAAHPARHAAIEGDQQGAVDITLLEERLAAVWADAVLRLGSDLRRLPRPPGSGRRGRRCCSERRRARLRARKGVPLAAPHGASAVATSTGHDHAVRLARDFRRPRQREGPSRSAPGSTHTEGRTPGEQRDRVGSRPLWLLKVPRRV